MKTLNSYVAKIQSLVGTHALIEVDRSPMVKESLRGFVIEASSRFLVVNLVDDSYFLNGFTIIRIDDIKRHRVVEDRADMIRYVLAQRYGKNYLQRPKIDLSGLEDFSFLERIHEGYPLITVFREGMNAAVCDIGRIKALKPKTFLLHTIDIDAIWGDSQRFRFEDVTRIDIGGSYEEALWMYAEHLTKTRADS